MSLIIQIIISVVVVYLIFSVIVYVVVEFISAKLQLRGKTLRTAIFKLLADKELGNCEVKNIKIIFGKPKSKVTGTMLTSSDTNTLTFSHDANKGQEFYYYAEITQKDGDKMYTSPVWVRRKWVNT